MCTGPFVGAALDVTSLLAVELRAVSLSRTVARSSKLGKPYGRVNRVSNHVN